MRTTKVFFASTLLVTIATHAADWPRFRGPNQDGVSKETGLNAKAVEGGAKIAWKTSVGTGFASITIANGRAYTMGNAEAKDTIWCLDVNTGKEIWKFTYDEELKPNLYEGGPNATPTVDGDRVYTLSKTGRAICLDAAKGTVIWNKALAKELGAKKPEWGFAGSVLIEGDLAIYNVGSAGTALNKQTGDVVWKSGAGASGYSQAIAANVGKERVAVFMAAEDCVAVNLKTGAVAWRYPWKTDYNINAADPLIAGQKVFVSSGYNHGASVFEVADSQPKKIWENKNLRNQFSSSVLWKDHIYGVDDNQLRCVDFATGEVKWTDKASGKGTLILADGKLLVLSEKGELMIADASPEAFKPLSRAQILGGKCWTAPALANGKLYARNAKGDLVCVELGGK
ncbi:MAG: Quinohemoprotein alcohol dehydrogenase precursor [Verrucomicrobiota bacterium]|jgi:outer membrane protein assembly factor BamB